MAIHGAGGPDHSQRAGQTNPLDGVGAAQDSDTEALLAGHDQLPGESGTPVGKETEEGQALWAAAMAQLGQTLGQ